MYVTLSEILDEKMGIISRVHQTTDVFNISEIANDFISKIYNQPNVQYETYKLLIDQPIHIKYDPHINVETKGTALNNKIVIYQKITKDNILNVKYVLIHELIHIIQDIRKSHVSHYTIADQIKYLLRKPLIDLYNRKDISTNFIYLLYREDIHEISAWGNNAYITAFKLKKKYPNVSNNKIMQKTLDIVEMNNDFLNTSIDNIKTSELAFNIVIGMLIGQFSELNGNDTHAYFDKSVFQLPVVKNMKNQVKQILNKFLSMDEIVREISDIVEICMPELQENKHIIIESFIKHLKYWFKRARVKLGKAIQLGIEDAEIPINKNHIITEHHKLSSKEIFKKLYNI